MRLTPEQIHKIREQWFYGTAMGMHGVAIIPQSALEYLPEIVQYKGDASLLIIPDRKLTPEFLRKITGEFKLINEL